PRELGESAGGGEARVPGRGRAGEVHLHRRRLAGPPLVRARHGGDEFARRQGVACLNRPLLVVAVENGGESGGLRRFFLATAPTRRTLNRCESHPVLRSWRGIRRLHIVGDTHTVLCVLPSVADSFGAGG